MSLTWMSKPLFIAHRGLCADYPENTMAAFQAAYDAGAKAVEFDVQLTKDNKIVIFHDDDVNRTTNGTGLLTQKTWAELSQLDAGSWFDSKFSHCKIPTLEEFVAWLQTHPMLVNIELKVPEEENCVDLIRGVVTLIHNQWPKNSPLPVLSSFSNSSMESCLYLAPEIPRAVLADRDFDRHLYLAIKIKAIFLNISENLVKKEDIEYANKRGFKINVFTVNDVEKTKQFIAAGVNGVFSDNAPELSLKYSGGSKKKFNFFKHKH